MQATFLENIFSEAEKSHASELIFLKRDNHAYYIYHY